MRKLTVMLLGGVICLMGVTSALAITYNEAPMLRTKVATGELPPVEERLPKNPFVVGPGILVAEENLDFEVGQYGGTLRIPAWGDVFILENETLLEGPGILAEHTGEGIVEGFEVSEDEKVFTFHLREGLRWSDGHLVTTEDVLFTYEDVLLNEKLTPVFPVHLRARNDPEGEPLRVEVIDEHTFRISFAQPYGGFPAWLAKVSWMGYPDLLKPKHYLKEFHIRYTPLEELEPLIAEEELSEGEWWTLFNKKDILNWEIWPEETAIGFPVLYPYVKIEQTPLVKTYERNPYYWKVDTEGNQLPYIDRMWTEVIGDPEVYQMKILMGDIDFAREPASAANLALYRENEERGGYQTVMLDHHMSPFDLMLNLTYADPVWRSFVQDVRFRKALSLAIDRQEIVDNVYFGLARPTDLVPSGYNPQQANRLLDQMGLKERDGEGYRLRPDGERLVIPFEFTSGAPDQVAALELVIEHWREVGIRATLKAVDWGSFGISVLANEVQATGVWVGSPMWWTLSQSGMGIYFAWPLWYTWNNTAGEEGEEPPAAVKRLFEIGGVIIAVSPQVRQEMLAEYYLLMYEDVWTIPLVTAAKSPLIISQRLGNVPHGGFAISTNFAAEQLFYKK